MEPLKPALFVRQGSFYKMVTNVLINVDPDNIKVSITLPVRLARLIALSVLQILNALHVALDLIYREWSVNKAVTMGITLNRIYVWLVLLVARPVPLEWVAQVATMVLF